MSVQHPEALALFALIPVLVLLRRRTRPKQVLTYTGALLEPVRPSFWKRHYEDVLYGLTFALTVLGIANIGYSRTVIEELIETKWLMLALDVSGSMKRPANEYSEKTLEDLALQGVEDFIDMRRDDDAIGIVVFSSRPRLLTPLTFDRGLLQRKLNLMRGKHQSRVYRELSAGGGTNAPEAIWLSLSVFFSMLPEEHRLGTEEIGRLRQFVLGAPEAFIPVPEKLKRVELGTGMAVILFTDGRIEPTRRVHGPAKREVPNLVNVIRLMKAIGVKLHIISVGGRVDDRVRQSMEGGAGEGRVGRVFVTSKGVDRETMNEVYSEIHKLEANRILSRPKTEARRTRSIFILAALGVMSAHLLLRSIPGCRRIG
jgi:hypothetical protein